MKKKIWRVTVGGRSFAMISMDDITVDEALDYVRAKWPLAQIA